MSWAETLRKAEKRAGRQLTLNEMIDLARDYEMTEDEINRQRESFVRAMMPTGDPRFD